MNLYRFEPFRFETLRRCGVAPGRVLAIGASQMRGTLAFITAGGRATVEPLPLP
jgi:hypothetical protein